MFTPTLICVRMKYTVVNVLYLVPLCLILHCWAFNELNLDCDFERDLCAWENPSYGYSNSWERTKGKASQYSDTGPSSDHTTGKGSYLLLSSTQRHGNRYVRLYSPRMSVSSDACLSFWYMMHGYDVAHLRVNSTAGRYKPIEIFSKFGPQGKRWYHAAVNVTPATSFRLIFEATYNSWAGLGDIAIDDISLSYDGGCSYDAAELMKDQPRFNCDFEVDLCSWYNVIDEGYIWKRTTIEADTNNRNALSPLTNGSSYVSIYRTRGSASYFGISLRGPTISVGKTGACMRFWYKMFLNKNLFTVIKHGYGEGKYNSGGDQLFSTRKQNGLVWEEVQITLPEGDDYNIVLRVIAYRTYSGGDVAVDDITLSFDGPCPEEKKESRINCDFDTNLCHWYMASPKDVDDWKRGQGPTPSPDTGPDFDHTKGDGYYMYLDASKVDKAILYSPFIDLPLEGSCLSFWYHMHGKDVAKLSLNLYEFWSGTDKFLYPMATLWTIQGEQGDKWIYHEISLHSEGNILLGFEAVRGLFPRGDIAIDDVKISFDGLCAKDITTTTTTTTTEASTSISFSATTTEMPKLLTPTLTAIGKVDPAFENTEVELICDGGNIKDTQFTWFSRQLDSDENVTQLNDSTTRKLILNEIQVSQAGTYWCELHKINHVTSDRSNGVLIKVARDPRPIPEITTDGLMEAEPAILNRLVKLKCGYVIEGATYHWKSTSPAFLISELPNNQTLLLHARPEHAGLYSCYVTKDGYSTASSKKFDLQVAPGKRCASDSMCSGQAYTRQCIDVRCECSSDAVLQDNSCELRPKQPKIYTSPAFLEFTFGETFYLVCEAEVPVPSTASYSFRRNGEPLSDDNESQTSNILKITNASEGDGGNYECLVTHRNIDSFHSANISVNIKAFANINCGFEKDLCEWSTQTGPGYVNVSYTSAGTSGQESSPSGPYIHVPKLNEQETLRAMLKSPTIKRTSLDSCLAFWYRMHGSEVYSLTVWIFTFSENWQENKGEPLWTTIGDRGKNWIHERITVPPGDEFYIAIEALGTVAIDDIVFTYRGSC